MKRSPAAIDERRAFAAQRFGGERRRIDAGVDGGRMELHELGVGDHGAGASRHGDGFAARIGRVGRDGEQRADAAGREDHGGGRNELIGAVAERCWADQAHAFDAAVVGDEVVGLVAFEHADRRRVAHGGDERLHDGRSRRGRRRRARRAFRNARLPSTARSGLRDRGRTARRSSADRGCASGPSSATRWAMLHRRCRRRPRSCRRRACPCCRLRRRQRRCRPAPTRSTRLRRAARRR